MTRIWKWAACAAIFSFTLAGCAPVESEVDSVTPAPGTVTESAEVIIVVDFSHSMSAESITTSTFMVVGSESGKVSGSFAFYAGETQVEFTPTVPFIEGEVVTVTLSDAISSQSDKNLDPYSWSFDIVPPVVIPPTPIQIVSTAPMIESNSGAMDMPSITPLSIRRPGPLGGWKTRTIPGDGWKPFSGFSALIRTSIA